MYKDKDKQREANAERQRRYKAKHKALPKGVTSEGVTDKALPSLIQPSPLEFVEDYTSDGVVLERRGKDIAKFEHLPPDVQACIDRLSADDQEHSRRTAISTTNTSSRTSTTRQGWD